jgi:hypothetical protein
MEITPIIILETFIDFISASLVTAVFWLQTTNNTASYLVQLSESARRSIPLSQGLTNISQICYMPSDLFYISGNSSSYFNLCFSVSKTTDIL